MFYECLHIWYRHGKNLRPIFYTKITPNLNISARMSWSTSVPVLSCLSGRLRELKNKGKVQLGNPKSGRGCLEEQSGAFHYKV